MSTGGEATPSAGFTIVEVLIVLAVSSALLISAYALVGGRQKHTQFTTSINDMKQQLQQIINETASGYFPSSTQFSCQENGAQKPAVFDVPSGQSGQGANRGCIFLGKAVQFGVDITDPGRSQLAVLPIVGRQYWNSVPITTLTQAMPRAAWPEGSDPVTGGSSADIAAASALKAISNSSGHFIQYGLYIASSNSACSGAQLPTPPQDSLTHPGSPYPPICFLPTGSVDTAANYVATGMMAILFGDNSGNIASFDSSNNLQSGAQQMSLYGVGPTQGGSLTSDSAGTPLDTAAQDVGNVPPSSNPAGSQGNLVSAAKLLVCVADDGTNQSGLFTISGDGSFTVTLDIKSNKTCQ